MDYKWIINSLPYQEPFLFVDELIELSEEHCIGAYTFPTDSFFYKGHFKESPITPGVILSETMAQIGLVSYGIFLLKNKVFENLKIALTSMECDFYLPVLPGEKVIVKSEKVYFRFSKLKCSCKMYNQEDKLICKGMISGMMKIG